MMNFDITTLSVECSRDGDTKVTVWCKCFTADDIGDVIAWLELAQGMMQKWEAIRKAEE